VKLITDNPAEARKSLVKNTFTPDDLVATVPLVKFTMAKDLTPADVATFQKFIDFSTDQKILEKKVDVSKYLQKF